MHSETSFQSNGVPILMGLLFVLCTLLRIINPVSAEESAVTLQSFFAEPLADGRVQLEWETGTEQDTASFFIIRTEAPDWPVYPDDLVEVQYQVNSSTVISTTAIDGLGSPSSGATYTVFDTTAEAGKTYNYYLVEEEVNQTIVILFNYGVTVTIGDIAQADFSIDPPESRMSSFASTAGTVITHTFTIYNTGNRNEDLRALMTRDGWDSNFVSSSGYRLKYLLASIAPNESMTLTVETTLPENVEPCSVNASPFTITAEVFNHSITKDAVAISRATNCIFIPVVTSN